MKELEEKSRRTRNKEQGTAERTAIVAFKQNDFKVLKKHSTFDIPCSIFDIHSSIFVYAMKVIVIGGGIIGLSSAYYLQENGHEVTVIDKSDMTDNCSYGNAGYVCPSHFVPLATPGIVKQGLKWMWNNKSPFYVQPRFSRSLVNWGMAFMKSATPAHVERSAIPLRDIAVLSKKLYEDWTRLPQFSFAYQAKGLLEIFQTQAGADHAHHTLAKAHELGLTDTELLDYETLQQLEPHTRINALGAVHFKCDAHLYPNKLMKQLLQDLQPQRRAIADQ
jgi:D-amino-acid dehydrogenase